MRTRSRLPHLFLAGGMALLLAACSGGSAPTATRTGGAVSSTAQNPTAAPATAAATTKPAAGALDVCSLLTQAEVDAATEQPLGPGKATIPTYDCSWATADFTASVTLTVSDWTAIKAAATSNGHNPPAVPGVGDEALSPGGGLLYVRKGDRGFLLLIGGPHVDSLPDQGLAKEVVLAAAVFGRF